MSAPTRLVFLLMAMFVGIDGAARGSWWEVIVGSALVAFWIYFIARAKVAGSSQEAEKND